MMRKYIRNLFLFALVFLLSIGIIMQKNLYSTAFAEGNTTIALESSGNYENANLYGNNLIVSDTNAGLVSIYDVPSNQLIKTFDGTDTDDGKLVNASLTTVFGNNLYIYCSSEPNIYKIYVYNLQTNEKLYCHNTFLHNDETKPLNKIVSLTTNSVGDFFAITKLEDNYVLLSKTNAETTFKTIIPELTLDESSKILISYSEENIFIITSSNIYKINSYTHTIDQTFNIANSFVRASIDKDDNIYLLDKNQNFITKLLSSTNYSSSTTITYNTSSNNISDFLIDVANGDLFILDNIHKNIYIENKSEDISNISNFVKYNPTTSPALTSQIEIAKTTKETVAYNYPYTISPYSTISEGQEVFILNKDYNFYLCLITDIESYNIYTYINSKNLEIYTIENNTKTIQISSQSTPIYKLPSSLKAEIGSTEALRLDLSISSGDTLTSYRLIDFPEDSNNKKFYEIKLENGSFAYIDSSCAYVVENNFSNEETTTPTLQTNAYVLNDNKNQIELFELNEGNYISLNIFIDSETKIQINKENFDVNDEYTEVKLIYNNEIITAYIKTENIRVDGVKIEIIIASILSAVCIILATVLTIYIRKNKNKMR